MLGRVAKRPLEPAGLSGMWDSSFRDITDLVDLRKAAGKPWKAA